MMRHGLGHRLLMGLPLNCRDYLASCCRYMATDLSLGAGLDLSFQTQLDRYQMEERDVLEVEVPLDWLTRQRVDCSTTDLKALSDAG